MAEAPATFTTGLGFVMGRINLFREFPLTSLAYLGFGIDAGIGQATGGRCAQAVVCTNGQCTCPGDAATWHGLAEEYGLSAQFLLKSPITKDTSSFSISLPTVRVEQLLSRVLSHDPDCTGVYGSCSGYSAKNLLASASVDVEWTEQTRGRTSEGCGIGVGVIAVTGDLADRENTRYMWFFRGGAHLDVLSY